MKSILFILSFVGVCLLSSCSSLYISVLDTNRMVEGKSNIEDIEIKFDNNALIELDRRKNKRYAKKSVKKEIFFNAIEITNNTENPIVIGQDVILTHTDGKAIEHIDPESAYQLVRQTPALYLLYGLIVVQVTKCTLQKCNTYFIPAGVPIALGNFFSSKKQNKKFHEDLLENYIQNKTINSGETIKGILCTREAISSIIPAKKE